MNTINSGLFGWQLNPRTKDPLRALIASLYGNGEQGAMYVPQPTLLGEQVLYQDAAGTVPVTADGDPVGRNDDVSGNGNPATQSVSANRPLYQTDGSLHWLAFDGAGDALESSFAPAAPYTLAAAISLLPGSNFMYGFGGGYLAAAPIAGSGIGMSTQGRYYAQTRIDGNVAEFSRRAVDGAAWVVVVRVAADGTVTVDDELGTETRSTALTNIQMSTGVSVGRPAQSSNTVGDMQGTFFGGIAIDRWISDQEVADVRAYLNKQAGV